MNWKKRILTMIVLVAVAVGTLGTTVFAASYYNDNGVVEPTRINLIYNDKVFDVGDTYSLNYEIYPYDSNVNMDVTWSSSNTRVATVDQYGTISCHATGTATISVRTERGLRDSISITVRNDYDYDDDYYDSRYWSSYSEWYNWYYGSSRSRSDYSSYDSRYWDSYSDWYDWYYGNRDEDYYSRSRDDYNLINSSKSSSSARASSTVDSSREVNLSKTADRETVVNAVKNATGSSVSLSNYANVSVDTLQAAAEAGSATINFDTRYDNALVGRLSIRPANAAKLQSGSTIKLGVYCNEAKTKTLQNSYNNSYQNKVTVVKCDQQNFGMSVRIYVKIGSGANADNLVFYSYDADSKTHSKITVSNVRVDENGFVGFDTTKGGTILISQGELQKA